MTALKHWLVLFACLSSYALQADSARFYGGTVLSAELSLSKIPIVDLNPAEPLPVFPDQAYAQILVKMDEGRTLSTYDYVLKSPQGEFKCLSVACGEEPYSGMLWVFKKTFPSKVYRMMFIVQLPPGIGKPLAYSLKMNLFKTPAELGETYLLFRNMENYPFTMPSELPADANSILELKLSELVEKLKKGPITKTLPPEEKPEEKKPEQKKEEAKDIKPAQAAPPVKAAEQKPAEKKPAEAKPASPPAPAAPAPPKTPPMDFLVDFGPKAGATPGNWNNLDDISNGRINNLISSDGRKSDVSLIVDDEFSATHDLGSKSDKIFPKTAGQDGFMVTGNGSIGKGNNLGVIRIENLEPKSIYNITIFASRSGPAGSKFASKFTIKGAKDTILCSDALDNKEKAVSANNVVPDASNTITINVTPYSQSGMQQEYGCINVLELKEVQNKR